MHPHAYTHFNVMHIPCMMDQHSIPRASNHLGNPDNTQAMDLTTVMPQRIQSAGNARQRQPPPHLPFTHSSSHSRPLPSIPSSTRVELHIPSLFSQNNEHCHFSSNNNEQCPDTNQPLTSNNNEQRPFYDTNQPYFSHNNQYRPLYDTNFPVNIHQNPYPPSLSPQRYMLPPSLPILKEPSTPSSPTYIPILTGRSDWCPWSEALTTAVIGMNLFGHIAKNPDSQWGFDPGSVPTYPLIVHQNSSPEEIQAWNVWWIRDGQVLHLLVSRLSPSVRAQLPGAGSFQP